jgi:hypothetical protein
VKICPVVYKSAFIPNYNPAAGEKIAGNSNSTTGTLASFKVFKKPTSFGNKDINERPFPFAHLAVLPTR